jgi:SAM-dependent methyltransferase
MSDDYWEGAAADYDERSKKHWEAADSLRDFVASRLWAKASVLDIGAGTGNWALFMAGRCARVTALDSSPEMRRVMARKIEEAGTHNIIITAGRWPAADVSCHNICFCAHAMYGESELGAFALRMDELAECECICIVRSARMAAVKDAIVSLGVVPSLVMGDEAQGERSSCILYWPSRSRRGRI